MFTSAHLHLCSSSHLHIYISAHVHICTSTSLLIFTSSHHLCSSSHPHIYSSHLHLSLFLTFSLKAGGSAAGAPRNATLCGDRACRVREMQARVRFGFVRRNPLRRSCVSSERSAGESAICPGPRDNPLWRSCASSARNAGESAIGELEDENWRLSSTTLVRGVCGELEDENWRSCSTT